jgi:predicted nucleotide-binding protein
MGCRVVVLDEQANAGRDVLGKLLDTARPAAFAVALFTGNDVGHSIQGDIQAQLRASQDGM